MKDTRGEDCGIWPIQIRGWPKAACNWHDKAYSKGSWAEQNMSRAEVDAHFLKMLLQVSENSLVKKLISYGMWGMARLLGSRFW